MMRAVIPDTRGVDHVLRFLLRKVVAQARRSSPFAAVSPSSRRPPTAREVQEACSAASSPHHAATDFGRDHRFDAIRTIADFRRQLPVAGYEYFEPYIGACPPAANSTPCSADPRVHMFALTSGTTATRKYIPVTPQYLADYGAAGTSGACRLSATIRKWRMRPIVQMSGDWDEYRTEAGIPCGSRDRPDGARCKSASSAGSTACRPCCRPDQGRRCQVLRRPAC